MDSTPSCACRYIGPFLPFLCLFLVAMASNLLAMASSHFLWDFRARLHLMVCEPPSRQCPPLSAKWYAFVFGFAFLEEGPVLSSLRIGRRPRFPWKVASGPVPAISHSQARPSSGLRRQLGLLDKLQFDRSALWCVFLVSVGFPIEQKTTPRHLLMKKGIGPIGHRSAGAMPST